METLIAPRSCSRYAEKRLLNMFTGVQPLTENQMQQLVTHYIHCDHCHIAIITILDALCHSPFLRRRDYDLWEAICSTREYFMQMGVRDDIPAYVDRWIMQGQQAAAQCYPHLSAHLNVCRICACAVQTVKELIQEVEKEGC